MIKQIPLEKFYRLLNIGPTVMVSAKANGRENVICPLHYSTFKNYKFHFY